MRKLFSFLFISGSLFAQQNKLDINHLTANFYIYTTYKEYEEGKIYPANGMYVVTNTDVIMIDSPWDSTQTQPLLDSIKQRHGKEVKLCITTHSHDDRTSGLNILRSKGVKTYSYIEAYKKGLKDGGQVTEFQFNKDTVFELGGVKFETYFPGVGHAPGNIVVWFPKAKVLFGGCFVKSIEAKGLGGVEDADLANWPIAIKNTIKKFKLPKFIIPGHQSWLSKSALIHTLYLLENNSK
jgi:metallo-beta-lactamase class B